MLNDSGPSLQLNNVTVNASQHRRARSPFFIGSEFGQTRFRPVSARSASIIFVNSDAFGVRLTRIPRQHSFTHRDVACRLLQCNPRRSSKTTTYMLQRELNAAARVVSDTKKFDQCLSRLMHQELHWLDIPERVKYKLGIPTGVCSARRQYTCQTVAFQSPKSLHDGIYAPLHVIS